jgi:hypothetical protein
MTAFTAQEKAVSTALTAAKEAVASAFMAQEKSIAAALQAADRAVSKAETATEKRFDVVNEFYTQLSVRAATLMPRAEFETAHNALAEKMETTNKALIARIDDLRTYKDTTQGQFSGLNTGWVGLLGLLGLADVIVTVYLLLRGH